MATVNIIHDVSAQDVLNHIKDVLTENTVSLNAVISRFEEREHLSKVWIGDQDMIANYPCITIEPGGIAQKWGASSKTLENTYSFKIFVYIKNIAHKEELVKYIMQLTDVTRQILTHPANLAFETPYAVIYDSFISNVTFGYRNEGAIRAGQLDYSAIGWARQVNQTG